MNDESDYDSERDSLDHSKASEVFNSGIIRKTDYFDLFISYKRDNGEDHGQRLAEELYAKLTADGFNVWIDNEEIGFSNDFELRIEQAILHSKKVACIISPAWVESLNCRFELKKAVEFEKRIIPVHYQNFRSLLKEKKNKGDLTDYEWRKVDKPQEVDFSNPSKYIGGYSDLKALCTLDNHFHLEHTRLLSNAYYWVRHDKPKAMLFSGLGLKKAKLLKRKCNADSNYPTFSKIQNDFLEASKVFSLQSSTNKRDVYIAYPPEKHSYASELNLELKLNDITTWFDELTADGKSDEKSFLEEIINCQNVIDVLPDEKLEEINVKVAFARSNNKRVIPVTLSTSQQKEFIENGQKNVFLWNDHLSIDPLITAIKGDEEYIRTHSKLFERTYDWEHSGKQTKKLLSFTEGVEYKDWYVDAEELGKEPQPNSQMIDYVERSISHAQALSRKKRLTFWSTAIGIVFLAVFITLFTLAKRDLKNKQDEALKERRNAQIARKQAKKDSTLAAGSQAEATRALLEAEAAKSAAEKDSLKAVEAQNKAIAASAIARLESQKALAAQKQAKQTREKARADSLYAAGNLANANAKVVSANKQLVDIKKESDSISFLTKARIKSIKALEFIQLGQGKEAKEEADSAFVLLRDSAKTSTNFSALYDVYYRLLPQQSYLSADFKQNRRSLEELIQFLPQENKYPNREDSIDLGRPYLFRRSWSAEISENDAQSLEALVRVKTSPSKVSAACLSPNGNLIAIGYENGRVEIWSKTELLKRSDSSQYIERVGEHSHRITSISFSPQGTKLAIASIDEEISIVSLNEDGTRDSESEVFGQNNGIRANRIYFHNEDVIITEAWENIYKAWSSSVVTLKKQIKN